VPDFGRLSGPGVVVVVVDAVVVAAVDVGAIDDVVALLLLEVDVDVAEVVALDVAPDVVVDAEVVEEVDVALTDELDVADVVAEVVPVLPNGLTLCGLAAGVRSTIPLSTSAVAGGWMRLALAAASSSDKLSLREFPDMCLNWPASFTTSSDHRSPLRRSDAYCIGCVPTGTAPLNSST